MAYISDLEITAAAFGAETSCSIRRRKRGGGGTNSPPAEQIYVLITEILQAAALSES